MTLSVGVIASGDAALWTPSIFGADAAVKGLDIVHWWDASDSPNQTLDGTSGKLTSWTDKVGAKPATQTTDANRPSVANSEVRFTGANISLSVSSFSRAYIEHTWFLILFRINWAGSAATTDGSLFSVNGTTTSVGMRTPMLKYTTSTTIVEPVWKNTVSANQLNVTASGSDVWHSLVARRAPDGAYASLDGAAETFAAGNAAMDLVPTGQSWTGLIGNFQTTTSVDWGLDTLILGQGSLTAGDVAKLHAWAMWRRGIQANQPAGGSYLRSKPFSVRSDQHTATPDSLAESGLSLSAETWDDSTRGAALDLTGFTQTFSDDFTSLSTLTDQAAGAGPWYCAGLPDTSVAQFRTSTSQTPTDTYTLSDATTLQIKMQKPSTTWFTGHIQTVNSWGEGFTQAVPSGGAVYYEASIAMTAAVGWPAFWLYSQNRYKDTTESLCEIDIVEAYGDNSGSQDQLHTTCFRHPASRPQTGNATGNSNSPSKITTMSGLPFSVANLFGGSGAFHQYGCMIDETWITFYFGGVVVSRFPTYPEALLPLYMLVSYQMQDDFVASATNPSFMWIDYVQAYSTAA